MEGQRHDHRAVTSLLLMAATPITQKVSPHTSRTKTPTKSMAGSRSLVSPITLGSAGIHRPNIESSLMNDPVDVQAEAPKPTRLTKPSIEARRRGIQPRGCVAERARWSNRPDRVVTMQPSCSKPRQCASGTLRWPANCSCSAALAQPRPRLALVWMACSTETLDENARSEHYSRHSMSYSLTLLHEVIT